MFQKAANWYHQQLCKRHATSMRFRPPKQIPPMHLQSDSQTPVQQTDEHLPYTHHIPPNYRHSAAAVDAALRWLSLSCAISQKPASSQQSCARLYHSASPPPSARERAAKLRRDVVIHERKGISIMLQIVCTQPPQCQLTNTVQKTTELQGQHARHALRRQSA